MRTHHYGWTLIELVVVVAVLAILVMIAYPVYTEQIIKSRRPDGMALLYNAAQREQQFYTVNNSFTATAGSGGLDISATSSDGYYTLSIVADSTTYTLTATRAGLQTADTRCGDLTLTHLGAKGNSGGSLPASKCW